MQAPFYPLLLTIHILGVKIEPKVVKWLAQSCLMSELGLKLIFSNSTWVPSSGFNIWNHSFFSKVDGYVGKQQRQQQQNDHKM